MPFYLLLRCHKCKQFCVQQQTKTRKWTCKVCCKKQSIIKIYFSSDRIKECRTNLTTICRHYAMKQEKTTRKTIYTYLSTHLIVPYFITPNGTIKRPEHLIAWWSRIFSFYVPDDKDHIKLRSLCRLFRDALKPPPLYTTFPHPNFLTLNVLMDKLNNVYQKDPRKAPKIVFVMNGTFQGNSFVTIKYSMKIIGAGQNKTFLAGYSFRINGTKAKGKRVVLKDMTMRDSHYSGLCGNNGLSFLCDSVTVTKSGRNGVEAYRAKGRLINCVITQCGRSGIYCHARSLIELEGSQTKVDGNVTCGYNSCYGLRAFNTSSRIHLLFPLTKESVSTNNGGNGNYGGSDTILQVPAFGETELCWSYEGLFDT